MRLAIEAKNFRRQRRRNFAVKNFERWCKTSREEYHVSSGEATPRQRQSGRTNYNFPTGSGTDGDVKKAEGLVHENSTGAHFYFDVNKRLLVWTHEPR